MSPVTRRQSMRLAEQADKEAEKEQTPSKPGSATGPVSGGRVAKPEPKARVVASRYMSAANPRKPEVARKVATRPTPTPTPGPATKPTGARARAGSVSSAVGVGTIGTSRGVAKPAVAPRPVSRMASTSSRRAATPIAAAAATPSAASSRPTQSEARSQIQFDENKAAATEELERLSQEAENAKRLLVDEQRKLKLMREYSALSTWLAANKQTLVDMGAQVSRVREPYTRFSEQLKQTTRAMPISGVYFRDGESLVSDMQGFVDAVDRNFPKSSENVQDVFKMASRVNQYYKGLAQEQDLVAECERLRQSLEHTAVLAISSKLGSASETS
ncbi:hypothetical protein GGI18_000314 [Coemansia linderi]|uniref:Uncharacterized protein n=1 Tax=Coemansia linderi TaxID=2663919 RepID=A0ACC1KP64_9FUNG|nr:hypothetical protein GGI18_000314 [Coemansia linderi]